MKRMNKEELIEYFLELLADNQILGKIMTKDEIRKKLNNVVKDVTYNNEEKGILASWNIDIDGKGIVNFDITKIPDGEEASTIAHELLHALSTSTKMLEEMKQIQKCGLHFISQWYSENGEKESGSGTNFSINEGMTVWLAEQITGIKTSSYRDENEIFRIVSLIIGEDVMLKKYFDTTFEKKPTRIFDNEIIQKYGPNLGINSNLRKVLFLSDQLTNLNHQDTAYGLNENGKRIQAETKSEIYNTLLKIIEKIVDNEPDFMKKINIMTKFLQTRFQQEISKKVLGNLLINNNLDYNKKLEILQQVRKENLAYIPEWIIEEMLFAPENVSRLTAEDKLQNYLTLRTDYRDFTDKDRIYDLYVESGKISEEQFIKRKIFKDNLSRNMHDIESMDNEMNTIKYHQIGEYYEITKSNRIYDQTGSEVKTNYIHFKNSEEVSIECFDDIINLEDQKKKNEICNQVNQIFEQYKIMSPKKIIANRMLVFIGTNMLRIKCSYASDKFYESVYLIDDEGKLEQVEVR